MSGQAEQKSFSQPDETRAFPNGDLDLIKIGGADIGRLTLRPGWRWSEHVKPIAGTDLCEAPHFQYHVQGTWAMAPSSTPGPATSPPCRKATTPGSSVTSQWSSWTGTGPATTQGTDHLIVSDPHFSRWFARAYAGAGDERM
jgi:hypothetical protein